MSSSNKKLSYTTKVRVTGNYKYLVKVSVFNANRGIVSPQNTASNSFVKSYLLSKGLYTLRIEINGEIKDEVFFIDNDQEYIVTDKHNYQNKTKNVIYLPDQYSSALLGNNYASSHEYYTYPAQKWSELNTHTLDISSNFNSSLFIFLRFPSIEKFEDSKRESSKLLFYDFELVDEEGEILLNFDKKNSVEISEQHGWLAFNASLDSGVYYLIYRGKEPRQIPIYVFKDWHTQFFMTLYHEPQYGTIRTFISKDRRFDPTVTTLKYIDILLDKLQNADYSLDAKMIDKVANGKYQSPLLGLICSYIYLKSEEFSNDELFKTIIGNMQNVILKNNAESPDLRALNILGSEHFSGLDYKKNRIYGTPMFRVGFEAILRASVESPRLIPQNSLNDLITENQYFDSPFNTFKPIRFKKKKSKSRRAKAAKSLDFNWLEQPKQNTDESMIAFNKTFRSKSIKFENIKSSEQNQNKYTTSIKLLYDNNLFGFVNNQHLTESHESWVENSIADLIETDKELSINDISEELGVSRNTINRVFNRWKKKTTQK